MMRIEGSGPNLDPAAIDHAGRNAQDRAKDKPDTKSPAGTDRVDLSQTAALAGLARQAAEGTPEIRQDLVDRMRAKLDAGEIGKDAEGLADKLIDHLIDS